MVVQGIDVDGQLPFPLEVIHGVFERGADVFRVDAETTRKSLGEALGVHRAELRFRTVLAGERLGSRQMGLPSRRQ